MTIESSEQTRGAELFELPFLYEIRVKGRLAETQWTSWFDDLHVTYRRGESILRGQVPDHAALYGLLARLRDLAVPLVAVRVLDSDAQANLDKRLRFHNLLIESLIALVFLLLLGGLVTATVFLSMEINVALALTLLCAALAGFAQAFWGWSGKRYWRWMMRAMIVGAIGSFVVWVPVSHMLPLWISLPFTLFVLAGMVFYGVEALRRRTDDLKRSAFGQPDPDASEE